MNKKFLKFLLLTNFIITFLLFFHLQHVYATTENDIITVTNFQELKEAISNANDGDTIGITDNVIINENCILGNSTKHITLKRMNSESLLFFSLGTSELTNITFDGNSISSRYSFLEITQNTTINNCVFKNCISTWEGGAINLMSETLILNNCTFNNNIAVYGGHISVNGGKNLYLNNCKLSTGHANSLGGAIYLLNANCSITSCTISNNTSNQFGGGIYNEGNMIFSNTKIYNNIASIGGADIYTTGILNIEDSIEDLEQLFINDKLKPIAWISDYNDDSSYLKLQLEEFQEIDTSSENTETELNENSVETENQQLLDTNDESLNSNTNTFNDFVYDNPSTTNTNTNLSNTIEEDIKNDNATQSNYNAITYDNNIQNISSSLVESDANGNTNVKNDNSDKTSVDNLHNNSNNNSDSNEENTTNYSFIILILTSGIILIVIIIIFVIFKNKHNK